MADQGDTMQKGYPAFGDPLATFKRDNRKPLSEGFPITYGRTEQHMYITAWTYETGPFDEQKVHCHCDMGLKVQLLLM